MDKFGLWFEESICRFGFYDEDYSFFLVASVDDLVKSIFGLSLSSFLAAMILARVSQMPPKNRAQKRFSNGRKGSWIPNKRLDNLK